MTIEVPDTPFFSIIIPTYNSENYILDCLSSIADQEFCGYEIIIQDGLSKDKTLELISSFQNTNPLINLKVISEPDNGIYDAMNKALSRASGKWIYFLGSDDSLYNKQVLHKVFSVLSRSSVDVLYGNVLSTKFDGIYDGEFSTEKLYNRNICHQAIFLKKEVFDTIGFFDTAFRGLADWAHNIKWFLNSSIKKRYIEIIIAHYGEGGFTTLNGDEEFFKQRENFFLKYGAKTISRSFRSLLLESRANHMKAKNNYLSYIKYKLQSYISRYA